jgi:hypothetical protein
MFTDLSVMLRDLPEISQFQVVQYSLDNLVVRYVPRADADTEPFLA